MYCYIYTHAEHSQISVTRTRTHMESWKRKMISNPKPSGRFKENAPCKKHPKHKQSPGVCSVCLNEKLSRLANFGSSSSAKSTHTCAATSTTSSSTSSISSLSSSNDSSCSSPPVRYCLEGSKLTRVFKNPGGNMFNKSRSTAACGYRRKKEEAEPGKRIDGAGAAAAAARFWSKILPTTTKRLMLSAHSKSTRERARIDESV